MRVPRATAGLCWLAVAVALWLTASAVSHNHVLDLVVGGAVFAVATVGLLVKGPSPKEETGDARNPRLSALIGALALYVVGTAALAALGHAVAQHASWRIDAGWTVVAIASGFAGSIGAGLAITSRSHLPG